MTTAGAGRQASGKRSGGERASGGRRSEAGAVRPRRGLPGGQYAPLTPDGVKRIHETTLRVLADIGFLVHCEEARDLFRRAGAEVDDKTAIVKVLPDLVMQLISRAPSVVRLAGRAREGALDCRIGGDAVYMGTGGSALNVQDPGTKTSRKARLADIVRMARLVDTLPNIHFCMLNLYPEDVPETEVDVNRFGAALNATRKHVMGGVYTVEGIRNVAKMAQMIVGSADALRDNPIVSMVTCSISPFKVDETYARLTIEAARHRIPVVVPAEPLCGATGPVTLAGNVVVQTADTLAGVMLAQLASPGAPVLCGSVASITDPHDLKYLSGAVEMGLLNAAAAQMARFYRLPLYCTAGMSDSKVCDAQAGYESAVTSTMVALAGGNLIHDAAGFLEFCMTASYEKLVIDDEIIGMVMRAVEGIRVDDESLAFDVMRAAGPGGHFLAQRHTRRNLRREQYFPTLSDRDTRDAWRKNGSLDATRRATARVREVLDAPFRPVLGASLRERILRGIPGVRSEVMAGEEGAS